MRLEVEVEVDLGLRDACLRLVIGKGAAVMFEETDLSLWRFVELEGELEERVTAVKVWILRVRCWRLAAWIERDSLSPPYYTILALGRVVGGDDDYEILVIQLY